MVLNLQGAKRVIRAKAGEKDGAKYYEDQEDLIIDGQKFHTDRVYNYETKDLQSKTYKVESEPEEYNSNSVEHESEEVQHENDEFTTPKYEEHKDE